jgi:hypothetical protein
MSYLTTIKTSKARMQFRRMSLHISGATWLLYYQVHASQVERMVYIKMRRPKGGL